MMCENREHLYHAAMMGPAHRGRTDLDQIWDLTDHLLTPHNPGLGAPRQEGARRVV